ncbi:DUF3108 domain-containing protein [Marinimicrobium sp. ABcell2]|uniref:DUF3108 domain-containing protein n=1 Tax=Marinimicrobium sp. ABcell2 TaxID=3069751 RepID=UPI0027AE335A|nr:DUF3108 domain-containing protein [Marinimicrobium sp. ABcell2]MDQ2078491.1 DUF3108 domain-containing protein [Marinimicrobium sp. ABcell2]
MPLKRALALFVIILPLCAGVSQAAEMPKTFKNEYSTRVYGFNITVQHQLSDLENGGQRLHFLAKTWFASIEEITDFTWSEEGKVEPLRYVYKRRGLGRNRDSKLVFDWESGKVTNALDSESWDMDVSKNIQDRLSYQVQLQRDLIDGKESLSYQIADNGGLRDYAFEVVEEEVLDTPLGKVATIKVMRSRDDDDRVTYAWLAKDYDYLLVRLQQKEDGDSHTISINKAELNGKRIERF